MEAPAALYVGTVVHKRARPKRHAMRYKVFSLLVDLDRLEEIDKQNRLFSLDRFNVFSLYLQDFGARDGSSPADFVRRKAKAAGVTAVVARVRMLAYPRIFGYAFNPLVVYFLEDAAGYALGLIYEVSNTFGAHHFYCASVAEPHARTLRHEARKALYVSPFNAIDGQYRFSIRPPAEEVFVGIVLSTEEGPLVTAYFAGERQEMSDKSLLRLALAYPAMTVKVLLGIHFEAMILWIKGVPTTLHMRRAWMRSAPARAGLDDDPNEQDGC